MSKHKFRTGDHVKIIHSVTLFADTSGATGKILLQDKTGMYQIKLDKRIGGYETVWAYAMNMERISKKPESRHPVIVITTDGKTATATLRNNNKVVKSATAKCRKGDKFDFAEGARIAFERLQGRDPFPQGEKKPTYYNGKVVCVEASGPWWTVGKVYDVVDGYITANDGDVYPNGGREPYKNAEDVRHAGNGGIGDSRHNPENTFIPFLGTVKA